MTDDEVAARIVDLVGGLANVRDCDRCFTRLRLVLADPDVVDAAAIEALPEVAMAFTQGGQFQVVLGGRVRGVHAAVRALLDAGRSR